MPKCLALRLDILGIDDESLYNLPDTSIMVFSELRDIMTLRCQYLELQRLTPDPPRVKLVCQSQQSSKVYYKRSVFRTL